MFAPLKIYVTAQNHMMSAIFKPMCMWNRFFFVASFLSIWVFRMETTGMRKNGVLFDHSMLNFYRRHFILLHFHLHFFPFETPIFFSSYIYLFFASSMYSIYIHFYKHHESLAMNIFLIFGWVECCLTLLTLHARAES